MEGIGALHVPPEGHGDFTFPSIEIRPIDEQQLAKLHEQVACTREALADAFSATGVSDTALEPSDFADELEFGMKALSRPNPVAGTAGEFARGLAEEVGAPPPFPSGAADVTYRIVDRLTPEFSGTDDHRREQLLTGIDRTANVAHLLECDDFAEGRLCPKTTAMISDYGWQQTIDDLEEAEKIARSVADDQPHEGRPVGTLMAHFPGPDSYRDIDHRLQTTEERVPYGCAGWRERGVPSAWKREGHQERSTASARTIYDFLYTDPDSIRGQAAAPAERRRPKEKCPHCGAWTEQDEACDCERK